MNKKPFKSPVIKPFLLTLIGTMVFWSCQEETPKVNPTDDSSQFVNLTDAVPDAILEIRYYSTYNFVGTRIDGYEEPVALLTREAAEALQEVSEELAGQGYRLKIYDAYRPQKAITHFINWAKVTTIIIVVIKIEIIIEIWLI